MYGIWRGGFTPPFGHHFSSSPVHESKVATAVTTAPVPPGESRNPPGHDNKPMFSDCERALPSHQHQKCPPATQATKTLSADEYMIEGMHNNLLISFPMMLRGPGRARRLFVSATVGRGLESTQQPWSYDVHQTASAGNCFSRQLLQQAIHQKALLVLPVPPKGRSIPARLHRNNNKNITPDITRLLFDRQLQILKGRSCAPNKKQKPALLLTVELAPPTRPAARAAGQDSKYRVDPTILEYWFDGNSRWHSRSWVPHPRSTSTDNTIQYVDA